MSRPRASAAGTGLAVAAALATALLHGSTMPAHGDPGPTEALCSGASSCILEAPPWLREGSSYSVAVSGNPAVRAQVVVYAVTLVDGSVAKLTPVSKGGDVLTSRSGAALARVSIPPLAEGLTGGWAYVGLAGQTPESTSTGPGTFLPLGGRNPTLLGDGYGELKPAGARLELHLAGTIPGTDFAVDYEDEQGRWHDISDGDAANTTTRRPNEVATVAYQMPRGLTAEPHRFRLRNLTSGVTSAHWQATPAVSAERLAVPDWAPPEQAEGHDTASVSRHPARLVQAVAIGIAATGAGLVVIGSPLARARARRTP